MISNVNSFQMMLDATIRRDTMSSMNPNVRAKHGAIQTIEKYIQGIPFIQNPQFYHGPNAFADRQVVKDHFCSFWKRELNLSFKEREALERIFDQNTTGISPSACTSVCLIFANENAMMSVQSMEEAVFDALDLEQAQQQELYSWQRFGTTNPDNPNSRDNENNPNSLS